MSSTIQTTATANNYILASNLSNLNKIRVTPVIQILHKSLCTLQWSLLV